MFYAIDVSKWQGAVNWAAVKNAGVSHAMLRAGYGNGTVDPQFKRNVTNCELHGVDWGCYWYSYATTADGARREAQHCLNTIKGLKPTMPIAYDIEYEPGILALTNAQRTAMVKAFLDEVENAGYYGILYASKDFIQNKLNWKELTKYDVWCAQYSIACTCPLPCGIWQYSSSNPLGIPGYGNSLDCNRVYKNYPAIIKEAGLNGWAKQTVTEEKPEETEKPTTENKLQIMTVGPIENASAMIMWAIANKLGLGYDAQYTDDSKTQQILTIGPASMGDANTVWEKAQELGVKYSSEWVE